MRILIAGEDRALGLFLKQGLELDGHDVQWMAEREMAAATFRERRHDLVVLDFKQSDPHAVDQIEQVRTINDTVPVLVLTTRNEVEDRVKCLDAGADDCMNKPLSLHEFRARTRALLRRRRETSLVLRCAGVELNRVSHAVQCDGKVVPLTNKEFALLEYLMMHPGACVSRASLLAQVWNHETPSDTNVVDVYINYLRRKLENASAPSMILTVRGRGYCVGGNLAAAQADA